jgi:hypothetical protein
VSAERVVKSRKVQKGNLILLIAEMKPEHLQCRDYGHAWKPYTAKVLGGRIGGYEYTLICSRCETKRYRQIGRTGALLKNNYHYEPGYLIPNMGRMTGADRDQLRLAMVMALLKHELQTLGKEA